MIRPTKMCKLCYMRPATVPDRQKMGRPIKEICGHCHAERLRSDLKEVLRERLR